MLPLMGGERMQMPEEVKPVTPPVPDPEPAPDPRDTHIARLNKENADRRIEAKNAKEQVSALEKKYSGILSVFEAETDEELETKLGEYRAARQEKADPNLDPKALLRRNQKLEDELKKTVAERDKFSGDFSTLSKRVQDKTIGGALREEIAKRGVNPTYHRALELDLRESVRLDDTDTVVWIQRDKTGAEQFVIELNEGVEEFFKKNPGWLPPASSEGSGSGTAPKPKFGPGKSFKEMSPAEYRAARPELMK